LFAKEKKTERKYFEGFRTRNSGVDVRTYHGKCTDPKSIVEFAEENMKNQWAVDLDEGDAVWCVFDVDENTDSVLKQAHGFSLETSTRIQS